jgi:putative flippase GtrA
VTRVAPALALPARFVRFAAVGGFAGVVDMVVVQVLFAAGFGLYLSRAISYLVAATVAWRLNRHFSFDGRRSHSQVREWGRYLVANLWGGLLNYGVYALLVSNIDVFAHYPFLAVAVGSAAGLALNFAMSSRFVFRPGGG